jgi:hypothetical protein
VTGAALKNPAELPGRLGLGGVSSLLVVDAPTALAELLASSRPQGSETVLSEARALPAVKRHFPAILLWREDRVGSRAALASAVRRMDADAVLWVVTAKKKVVGPRTRAVHRLELADLIRDLEPRGLAYDREVPISSWHVAYKFVRRET